MSHNCLFRNALPWVEANYERNDETVIAGLREWRKWTHAAIVSSSPARDSLALYAKLRECVPGMRIIPGLKPNGAGINLLPTFDSDHGWRNVGAIAAAICGSTGSDRILLDLEAAIYNYRRTGEPFDQIKFRHAISSLARALGPDGDREIIWYPSIHSHSATVQHRYRVVCETVADILGDCVYFVDRSTETPGALDDWWLQQARYTLEHLVYRHMGTTIPMLYAYPPGMGLIHWPDARIPCALSYVEKEWGKDAEFIVYPGITRWIDAAKTIGPMLPRDTSL